MTLAMLRRAALAAALLFLSFPALAQVPVPALSARVTDLTNTLSADQRSALEQRLAAFEASKGAQIAVLLVPTTEPEEIEQFGIRVAEKWQVGRKGVDDGAILIVAMKDRAVRIEVGYGLEGVLPDAVAKRIVEEYIIPRFKQGDFHGGIEAGTSRMMAVIEGEPLPPPRKRAAPGTSQGGIGEGLMIVAMLVLVVGGLIRAIFGRFLGSSLIGGIGGVLGWVIIGSIAAGVVTGIAAGLLSLIGGMAGLGSRGLGRRGWGGSYSGGRWGGGGGSWSGGGGGFGGGGASGRW